MYSRYLPGQEEFFSPEHSHSSPRSASNEPKRCEGHSGPQKGILGQLMEKFFGGGQGSGLSALFKGGGLGQLDKGDILLILILLYLYWESEDDEWLIILGLLFLFG